MPEPAETGQTAQRRQQWQGDDAQCATQAERQDQHQHDQHTGGEFQFSGTDLGIGENLVQFAEAIHQFHAWQIHGLDPQQGRVVQALQADQRRYAVFDGA
ncbi:hypothetical protein D3C86_1917150 [compost metagenome]